jgi:hypothetical protein
MNVAHVSEIDIIIRYFPALNHIYDNQEWTYTILFHIFDKF